MKNEDFSFLIRSIPQNIIKRIVGLQAVFIIVILLCSTFFMHLKIKKYIIEDASSKIAYSLDFIEKLLLSKVVSPEKVCYWMPDGKIHRYTIIDDQGLVICDNFADAKTMENHAKRPEILEAQKRGQGLSIHSSHTLALNMIYGAKKILIQTIDTERPLYIRQALSLEKVNGLILLLDKIFLFILCPTLVLFLFIGVWIAIQTSRPIKSVMEKILFINKLLQNEDKRSKYLQMMSSSTPSSLDDKYWPLVEKILDDTGKDVQSLLQTLNSDNLKLNTLMNSIPDAIVAISSTGGLLFSNKAFQDFFIERNNHNKSRPLIYEIIRDRNLQKAIEQILLDKQEKHGLKLKKYCDLKKEYKNYLVSLVPLPLDSSLDILIIFHDISDLELAIAMRENFISNVSHEVKTPLASLKGYLQLAQRGDQDVASLLAKMQLEINRMNSLFDELLSLSILEAGLEISKELISTEILTENAIEALRPLCESKNISLNIRYKTEKVYGNDRLLEQLILNLISNALKYTPNNGTVDLSWDESEGKTILSVSDNGIGIEKHHLSRIFERFYRIDPALSKEKGGTGLGLAIVKHIALKHKGKIHVTSELGKGTIFTLKMPLS